MRIIKKITAIILLILLNTLTFPIWGIQILLWGADALDSVLSKLMNAIGNICKVEKLIELAAGYDEFAKQEAEALADKDL